MMMLNQNNLKSKIFFKIGIVFLLAVFLFLTVSYYLQRDLIANYDRQNSIIFKDRKGNELFILPNQKGYWARYVNKIPPRFEKLLIKKEDRYFYYHFGINPWSALRAGAGYLGIAPKRASSTITQQLVKILLEKESERNLKNKIIESFYTLSLETYQSKETILKMYVNSVYFGNRAQGLAEASRLYFNSSPDLLTDGQILQLLATISSPTKNNPSKPENKKVALFLAKRLSVNSEKSTMNDILEIKKNMARYSHFDNSYFELRALINDQTESRQLTIDKELTEKIREIIKRNIDDLKPRNAKDGAAIVIKLPENEILALVGSPNPQSFKNGYKINMLIKPRPIGSTVKPFIYLKAFEKGARPYTMVNDREYKYITAIGFPLYPKNFDYKFRGEVSLHYALSNSLNVPAVKVLEYVGLENFYKFLENDLEFKPIQDLESYQLGIALGSLEMSLSNLAEYFTIFPNKGILKKLKIYQGKKNSPGKKIAKAKYIELINRILNDRKTGIEQFGLKSDLNLFQKNYALKTGTSRDFRDSWVIGYTPDFLVGVWLGNADNSPMEEITGQIGAGRIWSEIMETILNSEYNKKTDFKFGLIKEFYNENNIEYGLPDDNYEKSLNIMRDDAFILNPHNGDVFLLEKNTEIILKAKQNANFNEIKWFVDDKFLGTGENIVFAPKKAGQYRIKAKNSDGSQKIITIYIKPVK